MSQQLLREFYELCEGGVCSEMLTEEDKRYVKQGGLILTGKIQEADVKNGNGRKYPEKILRREVEKYQQLVAENRALGECVDGETEIFTTNGWKYIKDIADDETILTINELTKETEEQTISRKVVLDYKGIMYHIKNDKIDMLLTPNHNMLLCDEKTNLFGMLVKDFVYNHNFVLDGVRCCSFIDDKNIQTPVQGILIESVEHNGKVYCVTVGNGTWLMRRNGKIAWTKNCDHPESSVINLKNVSHMVTKIWWDGPAVMAKLKILPTPSGQVIKSLVESGVKLGISSRGLGSTHQSNGVTMVDDDFQLICFDMVSEPSTPGAFMMQEAKNRLIKNEKIQRLTEMLNKIVDG